MAKTYYKYAKRETTPVDYAGAAKGLSEGLMATVTGLEKKAEKAAGEVAAARSKIEEEFAKEEERKRKEDEALQKQYGDKVSRAADLPLSYQEDYKTVQSTILDLSSDAADLKAKLKRDYEAGKMTTKDYNRRVNNIRDQFKMMKQTAVTSLDMVNATNEAMQNGTALPIQHDMLTRILKGRFDSTNAQYNIDEEGNIFADITDPTTGKVERMSMYDMNKLSMQRFDVFDIDGQAESLVKDIGQVLENERGSGMTTEQLLEKEVMQRGNEISTPMDYIKKNVDGYSDNQLASILQMKMSQDYKRSMNPADFGNDDVVVYTISPISGQYEAKLTDNQKQAARDFATAAVLTQLNPLKKPATRTTATERKAAEYRDKNIKAAKLDIAYLRKIFEAKTPEDVSQVLARYSNQLIDLIPETERTGSEFIRAEVVGTGDNRAINVVYRDKYGTIKSRPAGVQIPDNFQDFVDSGGVLITGNDNLRTLREEAMAEISDPSSLVRGNEGGAYEVKVLEERLPVVETDATLSDAMDTVESELDSYSYLNMGRAYSDMSTAADDMFKRMGFEDYNITRNGDVLTISIPEYGSLDFNMTLSAHGDEHDNRRGAFKKYMEDIYTALTTGKKVGGSGKPDGVKGKKPTPIS